MMKKMPNADGLVQGSPQKIALKNMRWQPIYNSKVILLGSSTQDLVFTTVDANHAAFTNMKQGNFTPSPQEFDLMGVSVHVQPGAAVADLFNFYRSSALIVNVQEKDYVKLPIGIVPSSGGLSGSTTVAATTLAVNGNPQPGSFYPVHRKINIAA